jgi:hypothetical protein
MMTEIEQKIWTEPITDNEITIIEGVLDKGSEAELRKWLVHCLTILKMQREADG